MWVTCTNADTDEHASPTHSDQYACAREYTDQHADTYEHASASYTDQYANGDTTRYYRPFCTAESDCFTSQWQGDTVVLVSTCIGWRQPNHRV